MTLVRHALRRDARLITAVLVRTFYDDPFMSWLLPHEETRTESLRTLMELEIGFSMRRGHAYVLDDLSGAALWSPPDVDFLTDTEAGAFAECIVEHDPDRAETVLGGLGAFAEAHPAESCFYLSTIGIDPDQRSRGLGARLLRHVLDVCDREGLAAYLESSNPRNVSFYERHGFELRDELEMPEGPTIPTYIRKPGAG